MKRSRCHSRASGPRSRARTAIRCFTSRSAWRSTPVPRGWRGSGLWHGPGAGAGRSRGSGRGHRPRRRNARVRPREPGPGRLCRRGPRSRRRRTRVRRARPLRPDLRHGGLPRRPAAADRAARRTGPADRPSSRKARASDSRCSRKPCTASGPRSSRTSRTSPSGDNTAVAAVRSTELGADRHALCLVGKERGEPSLVQVGTAMAHLMRLVLCARARNRRSSPDLGRCFGRPLPEVPRVGSRVVRF